VTYPSPSSSSSSKTLQPALRTLSGQKRSSFAAESIGSSEAVWRKGASRTTRLGKQLINTTR